MTTVISKVVSEYSLVTFDVQGDTYTKEPSEAIAFAEGLRTMLQRLLVAPNAASLRFTNVVACRTLLLNNNTDLRTRVTQGSIAVDVQNSNMSHQLDVCRFKGPFSSQQFIQMMQFKKGITQDEWGAHLHEFAYTQSKL
jgi:hypothetical protein